MACKREAELLAEIEQTGAMYKVSVMQLIKAGSRIAELEALNSALCRDNAGLTQERDDLLLAIDRCEETKTALHMNLREAHKERDGLAAQNQALRNALSDSVEDSRQVLVEYETVYGTIYKQSIVKDQREVVARGVAALAMSDTSADILRARDARVLRDAAERLESHDFVMNSSGKWYAEASELRKLADDLEQKK